MEEKDIIKEEAEQIVTPSTSSEENVRTEDSKEAAATAAPEPPKKKKMSKLKLAIIIVACIILALGVAVGLFFLIGTLTAEHIEVVKGDFHNTPPDVETTFSAEELSLIESAMKSNASDEVIKEAIATIFAKANANKISADQAITVLQGQGGVSVFGAVGSMAVRGFKVQSGAEFYYQKAAPIVECDPVGLQNTLSGLLEQQERVYTDSVSDFRYTGTLKGPEARVRISEDNPMTKTLPFIPVGVPKKSAIKRSSDKESFFERGYYLSDPREITNFKIIKDYVVLKDDWTDDLSKEDASDKDEIKRIEVCQTEDGDRYYVCRFSLLIEGERHDDCVMKAREYLRASANSTDLEYQQFDVRLEVWENGFFKMMHDEEKWSGTVTAGAKSVSTSWYESVTYYNFNDEIFTEEDAAEYKGNDWAKKIISHYKAELDNA